MRKSYLITICLFLLTCRQMRAERIDTLLHFSYADLKMETLTAPDGNIYTELTYPDCGKGDQLGKPILPVKYIRFQIPADAVNIKYDTKTEESQFFAVPSPLMPIQYPATFGGNYSKPFVSCNNKIYASAEAYPSSNMVSRGEARVLDSLSLFFAVYPVRYLPLEKKCEMTESVHVSLTYEMAEKEGENKDLEASKSANTINLPIYDYCVITTRQLKDAFRRLIGWKRMKGYNAGVVCVEDILACPQITGDMLSPTPDHLLTDAAAKVRQYLRYAKSTLASQHGNNPSPPLMMYVLMGGDYSVVPVRYGTFDESELFDESNHIPSDLYYSEHAANWNMDNDSFLGESHEAQNFGANCYVGRILCTTAEEVENYTDKLLRYEMNPGAGDYSYLTKALYLQADEAQASSVATLLAQHNHSIFPTNTVVQEQPSYNSQNPSYPKGNDVVSLLNSRYGIASFNAHGNPYEIMVSTSDLNLFTSYSDSPFYALTSVQNARTVSRSETANGLDKLNNKNYPMIVSSVSCDSAPFDILTDDLYGELRTFDAFPCLAKTFTLRKDCGGPAWIGCTRLGLQGTSPLLQENFFISMQEDPIGVALAQARSNSLSDNQHYVSLSTNLIGCPELRVWTGTPSTITTSYDDNSEE